MFSTILWRRLRTWLLSSRATSRPRCTGGHAKWEVSKVGSLCSLSAWQIQKLFWNRGLLKLSWWSHPCEWNQLCSMCSRFRSISRSQQWILCSVSDWLSSHCRECELHTMWSWSCPKCGRKSLCSLFVWLICKAGLLKQTHSIFLAVLSILCRSVDLYKKIMLLMKLWGPAPANAVHAQ